MNYFEQFEIKKPDFKKRPLSYSSLKHFMESPLHYIKYINEEKESSEDMLLGSLVDCMILTPEKLSSSYKKYEKFDKRSNAAKEKYQRMLDIADRYGFEWVNSKLWEKAELMRSQIERNPIAMNLINSCGITQHELKWKYRGVDCRGFVDGAGELGQDKKPFILELKTSSSSKRDFWMRHLVQMKYHLQAGMYVHGWKREKFENASFYHIVVENTAPYTVNVFPLSKGMIEASIEMYEREMDKLVECMNQDQWDQGYSFHETLEPLEMPKWYESKLKKGEA